MKKITLLTVCFVLLTAFVSCSRSENDPDPDGGSDRNAVSSETVSSEVTDKSDESEALILNFELDEFDEALIEYLNSNGYYYSNFVISPASFRASVCLAAAGAEGNTRTEIVSAAGFSGIDELNLWHKRYQNAAARYSGDSDNDISFSMAASIWNNEDLIGDFTDSYRTRVQERYSSDAYVCAADELTEEINGWVSGKTGGMIPYITEDVYGASSVLVSSLYMQTLWKDDLFGSVSSEGVFSDINGSESTMGFIEQTGEFYYAEENGTKILVIPLKDNASLVCFTGNRTDMFDKMTALEKETVHVVLPKFEMGSVFDASDLLNFLITRGVNEALYGPTANYYNMCTDSDWFLQEIMQTSKISVGEKGTHTDDASLPSESVSDKAVKEFTADSPFSYAVFSDLGTPNQQMLLYGQMMTSDDQY